MNRYSTKKLVMMAMLSAAAYLMVSLVRIPVVLFLKYEPKDVIITIGGFLFGPSAALIIAALVSALEMVTISQTGIIGCIMNLLSSCLFACTAAAIYKKHHTLCGAVTGLAVGSAAAVSAMMLWNWLITPLYMGVDRQAVAALLLPAFLPFNLLKVGLNSALTLMLYKPLANALRHAGLITPAVSRHHHSSMGVWLLATVLLVTCLILFLVLRGIL